MTQAYRLQLVEWGQHLRYIITGNEWFTAENPTCHRGKQIRIFCEETGGAIIYPEHDLLWIGWGNRLPGRFKTVENFEKEFSPLPRWEATRYAVVEWACGLVADHGRNLFFELSLYDCRTGQHLVGDYEKAVPGREAEVERLRRGIEQLMRGEEYRFM